MFVYSGLPLFLLIQFVPSSSVPVTAYIGGFQTNLINIHEREHSAIRPRRERFMLIGARLPFEWVGSAAHGSWSSLVLVALMACLAERCSIYAEHQAAAYVIRAT